MSLPELISVARGDRPADLVLKDARIINTFTGEIEKGDVAVYQDRIAGIGEYRKAKKSSTLKASTWPPDL